MRKKFDKFMTFASILILISLICDVLIDNVTNKQEKYFDDFQEQRTLLENKMVKHCLKKNESFTFMTDPEGLRGECGFIRPRWSEEEQCYIIYTFGEHINGSKYAIELVNIIEQKPKPETKLFGASINLKTLRSTRIVILVLALIFSSIAIKTGFNWKLKQRKNE